MRITKAGARHKHEWNAQDFDWVRTSPAQLVADTCTEFLVRLPTVGRKFSVLYPESNIKQCIAELEKLEAFCKAQGDQMAIAGAACKCQEMRIVAGLLREVPGTSNKSVVCQDPKEAIRRLAAGEQVDVIAHFPTLQAVREGVKKLMEGPTE